MRQIESLNLKTGGSNFIKSGRKFALYNLVVFQITTPKSNFLFIEAMAITYKGPMNTTNFGKTLLLIA